MNLNKIEELSDSNKIGFCARPEGRKNPHFLDGLNHLCLQNHLR